jgi:hypothetical protein
LIRISKEEKFALVKEHPNLQKEIYRSEKQRSNRHGYYITQNDEVVKALAKYWRERITERLVRNDG